MVHRVCRWGGLPVDPVVRYRGFRWGGGGVTTGWRCVVWGSISEKEVSWWGMVELGGGVEKFGGGRSSQQSQVVTAGA